MGTTSTNTRAVKGEALCCKRSGRAHRHTNHPKENVSHSQNNIFNGSNKWTETVHYFLLLTKFTFSAFLTFVYSIDQPFVIFLANTKTTILIWWLWCSLNSLEFLVNHRLLINKLYLIHLITMNSFFVWHVVYITLVWYHLIIHDYKNEWRVNKYYNDEVTERRELDT